VPILLPCSVGEEIQSKGRASVSQSEVERLKSFEKRVLAYYLSVRVDELGSSQTDFCEILYWKWGYLSLSRKFKIG
jgi:hypothetical protein